MEAQGPVQALAVEEFARRVASVQTFYPYLVAEENGELLGYAYAHRIAERAAYRSCLPTADGVRTEVDG